MTCHAHALAASRRMLVGEDVDLIRGLVALLLRGSIPLKVIDLGDGSGTTALAVFAEAPVGSVIVYTLDEDADALNWAQAAVDNVGRLDDWRRFWGPTSDPAANRAGTGWVMGTPRPVEMLTGGVDLLLVDAAHDYDGVRADLFGWLPLLNALGRVWVHDYGDPRKFGLPSDIEPGVKKAVDDVVESGQLFTHAVMGLGWAGAQYPQDKRIDLPSSAEGEEAPHEVERSEGEAAEAARPAGGETIRMPKPAGSRRRAKR